MWYVTWLSTHLSVRFCWDGFCVKGMPVLVFDIQEAVYLVRWELANCIQRGFTVFVHSNTEAGKSECLGTRPWALFAPCDNWGAGVNWESSCDKFVRQVVLANACPFFSSPESQLRSRLWCAFFVPSSSIWLCDRIQQERTIITFCWMRQLLYNIIYMIRCIIAMYVVRWIGTSQGTTVNLVSIRDLWWTLA